MGFNEGFDQYKKDIEKDKSKRDREEALKAAVKAEFTEKVNSLGNGKIFELFSAFVQQANFKQYKSGFNSEIKDATAIWSIWFVPFLNQDPIFNPGTEANACTLKFSVYKNTTNQYVLSVSSSMYRASKDNELGTSFHDDMALIPASELDMYLSKFTDSVFKWKDLQGSDYTKK